MFDELNHWMSYKSKATQNCHAKGKQRRQQIMHVETSTWICLMTVDSPTLTCKRSHTIIVVERYRFWDKKAWVCLILVHKRNFCACLWIIMNKIIFHYQIFLNFFPQIFKQNFFRKLLIFFHFLLNIFICFFI